MDIDEDVLELAKALAVHRKQSIGKVISNLCRKNLKNDRSAPTRNGLRIIHRDEKAAPVTMEVVNRLRDEVS